MSLVPYTITALERDNADAVSSGKQVIVGATCSMFIQPANTAVQLFDNAAGANGSTAKTTGANGQVTVYIDPGEYRVSVNGTNSFKIVGRDDTDFGTAAIADVTTSTTDTTIGRVIRQGDTVSLSDILTSGFFTARSSSRSTTTRSGTGGGGSIFPTLGSGPQQGMLYAINITSGAYLVATVRKLNAASVPVVTILNNSGLTVAATNAGGTISLSDISADVKMFVTINIME